MIGMHKAELRNSVDLKKILKLHLISPNKAFKLK